eukprot:CAMPEP_0114626916 /NCGR_PEP_ID=MMETSP0168-20121206/12028_1 /TAXON_ID=95228 ORGANISM="Vannella sp., Strain DIVA3 517/6/12" /NCGR_SAMPLE_ID=MMETSP0168 /ASSEMBLY_ACC=CAM_ASM_000044 /LENGTH=44 /DNA_ID= /DNA_START= /DNA_END= /DNA_ORIENTATION=
MAKRQPPVPQQQQHTLASVLVTPTFLFTRLQAESLSISSGYMSL